MATFEITYFFIDENHKKVQLGKEQHIDVEEWVIPKQDKIMVLTKRFSEKPEQYFWFIRCIHFISCTEVEIKLEQINQRKTRYLSQILKHKHKKLNKTLYQWSLVEVDFGFPSEVRKADGAHRSSKRYINLIQPEELHKRRLAIVWKVVSPNLVKVIPVTSQQINLNDKSQVKLSYQTLNKLKDYNNPKIQSVVLTDMIQTVSVSRILPVRFINNDGRIERAEKFHLRVDSSDKKNIRDALFHTIDTDLMVKYDELNSRWHEMLRFFNTTESELLSSMSKFT